MPSSIDVPPRLPPPATRRRTSSPQKMASEVGTELAAQRKSHFRRSASCSAVFAFNGLESGVSSQALISAGIGFSNHVR